MFISVTSDLNVAAPAGFETTVWHVNISCLEKSLIWRKSFMCKWLADRWVSKKLATSNSRGKGMTRSCAIIELKPVEFGSPYNGWDTTAHIAIVQHGDNAPFQIEGLSRYLWLAKKQVQRRTNFGHIEWSGNKGVVIS